MTKGDVPCSRKCAFVFQLSSYSINSSRTKDGTMSRAEARLRLTRLDDNIPPRRVRIAIQAGPEPDEGEAQILAADVEEQLIEILAILGVRLDGGPSGPEGRVIGG